MRRSPEGGAVGVPWQIGTRTGTPTAGRDAHTGTRGTPTPGRGGDAGDAHTGTCTGRVGTRTGRVRDAYGTRTIFIMISYQNFFWEVQKNFFGRKKMRNFEKIKKNTKKLFLDKNFFLGFFGIA